MVYRYTAATRSRHGHVQTIYGRLYVCIVVWHSVVMCCHVCGGDVLPPARHCVERATLHQEDVQRWRCSGITFPAYGVPWKEGRHGYTRKKAANITRKKAYIIYVCFIHGAPGRVSAYMVWLHFHGIYTNFANYKIAKSAQNKENCT